MNAICGAPTSRITLRSGRTADKDLMTGGESPRRKEKEMAIASKEEERKALEQIRKIVAGLGEDSYVATAFEGCFEIAEENISNDWAGSMKQKLDNAEFAEDQLRAKVKDLTDTAEEARMKAEDAEKRAEKAESEASEYLQNMTENAIMVEAKKARIEKLEEEIIRLKAKLYDLMIAEK